MAPPSLQRHRRPRSTARSSGAAPYAVFVHGRDYPRHWRDISARIRQRDAQRCRWCGVRHGDPDRRGHPIRLGTMRLDGEPWNVAPWNLVAACPTCHGLYDAPHTRRVLAARRVDSLICAGQLPLDLDLL